MGEDGRVCFTMGLLRYYVGIRSVSQPIANNSKLSNDILLKSIFCGPARKVHTCFAQSFEASDTSITRGTMKLIQRLRRVVGGVGARCGRILIVNKVLGDGIEAIHWHGFG